MGIFSLSVIVIIFAVMRVSVVVLKNKQLDETWLYMWSLIEMAVGGYTISPALLLRDLDSVSLMNNAAVVVACLSSFRQLFVKSQQAAQTPQTTEESHSSWTASWLPKLRYQWSKVKFPTSTRSFTGRTTNQSIPSLGSRERIVPLTTIYVERSIDHSSMPIRDAKTTNANVSDAYFLPPSSSRH